MGFSLGALLEAFVLVVNALAILNDKRFLKKRGLEFQGFQQPQGDSSDPIKQNLIPLLFTCRTYGKCKKKGSDVLRDGEWAIFLF